jgi:hypothetical protein
LTIRCCARVTRTLVALASLSLAARAKAQDSATAARSLPPVDVHGFIQVYYRSGDPTIKDGFRLRKSDLKFSGVLSPKLKWRVTFDAAKALTVAKSTSNVDDSTVVTDVSIDQRTRILQDAALTYTVDKSLSFDVGQQIIPLSLEGTISTSNVETIERTLFIVERSRAVGLGDIRDVGVSANGQVLNAIEYHLGVFNETGEGAGTIDSNDQKSFMGRVAYKPSFIRGLSVGGSGGFEGGPTKQRRERTAGEIQFRDERITLRTEVMSARDGTLRRFGWYALTAVRPTKRLQFVGRWDDWDRDRSGEHSLTDATERQVVVGASILLDTSAKIAFNAIHQTFPFIATPKPATFFMAAFQAIF